MVCLTLQQTAKLFPRMAVPFYMSMRARCSTFLVFFILAIYSLWLNCLEIFPHFLNWMFLSVEIGDFLIHSVYKTFVGYVIFWICDLQRFVSPSLWLVFSLFNMVIHRSKVFNFDKTQFTDFFLLWTILLVSYLTTFSQSHKDLLQCFHLKVL